jgi:hypothetical protein
VLGSRRTVIQEDQGLHLTGVEGVDTEYWITKDCGSRSWIGEEGPSSRDHTGQGEERTEAYTGGFQQKEATGECWSIQSFPYKFSIHIRGSQRRQSRTSMGHSGESHRYPWVTEETVTDA